MLVVALLLVACGGGGGGETNGSSAPNAANGVEFPLSKELAQAVQVSQGNLRLAAVLDGVETTELDVAGLSVDPQSSKVSGQLTLPAGSHTLAVYYYLGVACGDKTEVRVAKLGPATISVTANAQTQVSFDAIDTALFDDDKDGVSNLTEINQKSLWCDASSSTPPIVLLSPQNLRVDTTAVANGVVTLLWDPVPDATDYKVYLGTDSQLAVDNYETAPGGVRLPLAGAAPISGSPYTIPADKVKAGLTYYFIVVAHNSVQNQDSPSSDRLGVFIGPPPPAPAIPNRVPVAANDVLATTEDTPVDVNVSQLLANDTDPDNDTLILALVSGVVATQGKLEFTPSGVYRYTPALNYNGAAKFQYTVQDGRGGQATATVNITVAAVNDAPVPQDDAFTTNEDTALETFDILSNDRDVDGNVLTVKSIGAPTNGTLTEVSRGIYRYVPNANFTGQENFKYTVSDGSVDVVANLKISVIAANDAPVAQNDVVSTNEDTASNTINVLANDTDADVNDKLTVTNIAAAQHGVLSLVSTGNYRYVPAANFSGTEAINYTISDGKGGESTATITITVNPVNDAPVAVADAFSTPQDTALQNGNVLTNDSDVDGNPLTVTFPSSVSNGTLAVVSNGVFNFTPAARFSGQAKFSYTLDDGAGGKATGNVTVNVNHVNHPPVANDDSFSTNEDTRLSSLNVLANDTDSDNDKLTVVAITNPQHGALTALNAAGTYRYDPDLDFNGTETLTYTIDDGGGAQASASVTITVLPVVDRVTAAADTAQTTRDKSVTLAVLANDTDPDGNAALVSFTPPKFGAVVKNADNTLTYTPNADATLAASVDDTFTYTMGNSKFNSTASVVVTVLPIWSGAKQVNVTTNIAHAGDLVDPSNLNSEKITDPLKVLVDKNSGIVTAIWEEKMSTELRLFAGRMVNGAWSPPEQIDHSADKGVTGYDAVIDGNGVVTVLFIQSDGSLENVWSRRYTDTWQPEQAVESAADPVTGGDGHGLVVDGQNVLTAFWVQDGSVFIDPVTGTRPRSRIIMSSRFANNAWTTPAQVERFPVGHSLFRKAAVDQTGAVTAFFTIDNQLVHSLFTNRFESGDWGATLTQLTLRALTSGSDSTRLLDVVINNAGDVLALTAEYEGGDNVFVFGVFRPFGQNWQTAQLLGPPTGVSTIFPNVRCCDGRLVIDSKGVATAFWDTVSAQGVGAKLAARHDGSGWTPAVSVSTAGTGPDTSVVGVDAMNDRVYAAFTDFDNLNVTRFSSGQWEAPTRIDSAVGSAEDPALVIAQNGNATVIWEQGESTPPGSSQWAARLENGVWQPAQLLESRSGYASFKQLVMDQSGTVTAVWQQSTPQGWVLLSNTYR